MDGRHNWEEILFSLFVYLFYLLSAFCDFSGSPEEHSLSYILQMFLYRQFLICANSSEMMCKVCSFWKWELSFSIACSADGLESLVFCSPFLIFAFSFFLFWYWSNDFSQPIGINTCIFPFSILFLNEAFWRKHYLGLRFLHSVSRGLLSASGGALHACSFLK